MSDTNRLTLRCPAGHEVATAPADATSTEPAARDALVAALRLHIATEHAGVPALTDAQLAEFVATALRLGPAPARLAEIGLPEVLPLTAERLPDFVHYFDDVAFTDNPAWASCYCMFFRFSGSDAEWRARGADANRADVTDLVMRGEPFGFLAYSGGRPAGWCAAAPRTAYPGFEERYRRTSDERVGSIVCFVIAPPFRRHGIARTLLDAVTDSFRARGLTHVEAYPARAPTSDGAAYHGPLSMYLKAGFEVVEDGDSMSASVVVRRAL